MGCAHAQLAFTGAAPDGSPVLPKPFPRSNLKLRPKMKTQTQNQFVITRTYFEHDHEKADLLSKMSEEKKAVLAAEYPSRKAAEQAMKDCGLWDTKHPGFLVTGRDASPMAMPYIH